MAKDDDSDSDENEQIRRSGRQRKRAKNVPQPQVYSSSEDEGSDNDYNASKRGKVKAKSASAGQKKSEKKPAGKASEASEEGEVESSSESDDSGSSSGSSDDSSSESSDNDAETTSEMSRLVTDEEDKKRLMSMTEREREEELFQRLQRKTMIEKRRELERKLKQKTSAHATSDDKAGSSTSQRRHSSRKEKVSKGLEDLKSERKARKDKEAKRHADTRKRKGRDTASSDAESSGGMKSVKRERVHARDIYGSDEDDANVDIDGVIGLKPIPRSKVTSGDGDELGGVDASRGGDDEEKAPEMVKITDLRQAQVFRRELVEWLYAPFLRQYLIGVYVRINVGTHPDRNEPVYRIGQIEDIIEATDRTYEIEGQRTNKYLKLKLGMRSREFRISYVSNCEITNEEFKLWLDVFHHFHVPLVTPSEIVMRDNQLTEARAYHLSDDELNKMLEAKKAMNANCLNPATGKAQLRLELQRLFDKGASQPEIDAMQKQIRIVDDIISRREKNNSSNNLMILGKVSQRNKLQNIETAMRLANPAAAAHAARQQQQQHPHLLQQQRYFMPPPLSGAANHNSSLNMPKHEPMDADDDDEGDPFTRRRTTPRMFLGAKARSMANGSHTGNVPAIKQESSVDDKNHVFLMPKLEQLHAAKFELRAEDDVKPVPVKPSFLVPQSSGPRDEFLDLFDVEVGDLDIRIT